MYIANLLCELEDYKKEYLSIASKYESYLFSDDNGNSLNFGSQMWLEAYYYDCNTTEKDTSQGTTILEDMLEVTRIILKVDALCDEHRLSQFLINGTSSFWLGVLPEPYSSSY